MKWPLLLLALLIAMAAAASVAVVLGDRGDPSREIVHGQYSTMLQVIRALRVMTARWVRSGLAAC